jgi:predicted Rossmann fold flavoprotein
MTGPEEVDVLVVGAGAAGIATAIFAARHARQKKLAVRCVDGARRIGAKILVSGGSRCNVTNRTVAERDFWGGDARAIARVLRAFPATRAASFFEEIGVALHEEEDGKLFPDSGRSRTVVDALLRELARLHVAVDAATRVETVSGDGDRFLVGVAGAPRYRVRRVVLATGGRSLPKTGSDGHGYLLAERLGHCCVKTTPALAPLVLEGTRHAALAGVAHRAGLTLWADGKRGVTLEGSLLWTHFGISGPVALNLSRHWHRATLDSQHVSVSINVCPGETFETMERWLLEQQAARPRAFVHTVLSARLPAAVAEAWTSTIPGERTMAHLGREERRGLVQALLDTPLHVVNSRGYGFAEVTAGGIPLEEINPATMESRVCPGLFLVGEILDVDGRLGGFNFQWAWSSGWVAGRALAGIA